ncbi:unnamed protein product [Cyprideis torosa]|uniref:Uncharacterized protein n=1 Tax=Cyprideis torosa TaxID=163714 RepID=A0A7R8WEC9_9CRUS|nr:unnamed protein product [Cyprideis torosa]CAG0895684.1 unnamed protein product [Cyprideis torosa]
MSSRESKQRSVNVDKRVLDQATRNRRMRRMLDNLERDNFQEDPHANLSMHKKAPKFEEQLRSEQPKKKKKKRTAEYYKQRFRKTFEQLLEEPHAAKYLSASASKSDAPGLKFCGVCGRLSSYTCVTCGTLFCRVTCYQTHKETRCLKWIA